MALFDDSPIELSCPKCSHKFTPRLGKLKTNPTLTCAGCGASIEIDANQAATELKKVDDAVANLRRTLGSFNKKR